MRTPETRSGRTGALLAACLLALPAWAAALTLDEALQLAERQAPSLAAQAAGVDAARNAAIPAGELPDPKLLLGLQNVPAEGPDRGSLNSDFMTMQMVGVMQEVPNRAKRRARVEVAQAGIRRADAEQRIERLRVRRETAMAWISTLAVEQKLDLFANLYEENRLLAKAVQARIAGARGQVADSVVPKQEAALLAEEEDRLIAARTRQQAALRRWIGETATQAPVGRQPQWPVDAQHYRSQLQRHPELSAFAPMTEEAEARVREALADKRPDWSWELDYQRRGRAFGDMLSLQFSVDLPLFPGARQNPRIAARHAELDRVQAEREALEREHAAQLAEDLAEYQRLDRAVQRSQDSLLPLAEEKRALTMAGYRAGSAELGELVAARRELIEARLRHIDLEEQRALSNARLYFAYGESP
ncbi:TolC family protein [Pseudomonas lalucatii]|uniref:TolC family protein n=1 Tax=Pseudomonas lalucatii TaxID=1424203 RepID=A0ABS5PWL7_9PSED|nr:TolC family protein [Pseudomonas lalucatii]MBS7660892.1 TolC family protein [Pseudomonas lalucatii]MBS7724389.1 TolC family protein [Pseudomonas lalucatii]